MPLLTFNPDLASSCSCVARRFFSLRTIYHNVCRSAKDFRCSSPVCHARPIIALRSESERRHAQQRTAGRINRMSILNCHTPPRAFLLGRDHLSAKSSSKLSLLVYLDESRFIIRHQRRHEITRQTGRNATVHVLGLLPPQDEVYEPPFADMS
jgi:hypothetical protein